jgi:hypothetical protein
MSSTVEVFLKNLIIDNKGNWSDKGIAELLKDAKYSLYDAYEFFKTQNATRESLITHFYSFQSVSNISGVFDKLTGEKFLYQVLHHPIVTFRQPNRKFNSNIVSLEGTNINFTRDFNLMFETRHKFIHELEIDEIEPAQVDGILKACSVFAHFAYDYCKNNSFH